MDLYGYFFKFYTYFEIPSLPVFEVYIHILTPRCKTLFKDINNISTANMDYSSTRGWLGMLKVEMKVKMKVGFSLFILLRPSQARVK